MRPSNLGDSTSDESRLRSARSSRVSSLQISPIRNPYERPTTSKKARERGELEMTVTRDQHRELSRTAPRGAARRKQPTYRQRQLADLRKIVKLQNSTNLLIPKAAFSRVVREISLEMSDTVTHYTATALEALHEATEMFLTQVLQDSYMLTLHRKCVTLSLSDMVLLRALKLDL